MQLTNRNGITPSSDPQPEVFGFALLCSPAIVNGKGSFVASLMNRTTADITVKWVNTHLYKVTVTGSDGNAFDMEQVLPAPLPDQPDTIIPANSDFSLSFLVDTNADPYAGKLVLSAANAPYKVYFALNSSSHFFSASAMITVVD